MIRVLIAEDSKVVRTLLARILESDPEVRIAGQAADGLEAVAMAQRLVPDVITMDIQMPNLDGLEATRRIMAARPTPIVIVSGALRGQNVNPTFEALCAGALAVVEKPAGPGYPDEDRMRRRVLATIKSIAQVKVGPRHLGRADASVALPPDLPPPACAPAARVVAIGASTGGPAALARLLRGLPADLPAAVLVVQHISEGFTRPFAEWLNSSTALNVRLASAGDAACARTVYVAPDGHQLGIRPGGSLVLTNGPLVDGHRPSATYLLESVAAAYGKCAVGVLLTGMGADGARGLLAVRRAGGGTLAQDRASSVVYGMPGAAVALGAAEQVLPPERIAAAVAEMVRH